MSALTRTKRKRPDQITTSTTVLTLQHTVTTRTPLKSIENLPRPIEKRKRNVEQVGRWTRKKLKEANAEKKATQEAVQKNGAAAECSVRSVCWSFDCQGCV